MKYFYITLLLLPTFVTAQSIEIQGAAQIDAKEVLVGEYPGDEEILLFVNYDSDIAVEDSTFTNLGGYDIGITFLDDGYLDYGVTLATSGSEKWYGFEVLSENTDSAFYIAQFQDSLKILFEDEDDDSDVWRNSTYSYPVGIMMSDESDILWRSYIGNADTSIVRSTHNDGHLYLAGKFSDSLEYADPTGLISEFSLAGTDEGIFLMSLDNEGTLDWMVTLDGDEFANVANVTMIGDDVSLLYNNIEGSTMIQIDTSGNLVRLTEWDNCIFVHSAYEYGSLFVAGWVDTDKDHNLDLNGETFTLPSGNDNDGTIISYDDDLNINWVQNIAGANRSHITNFDFTSDGSIYATGHIRGESTIGDDIVLIGAEDNHDLLIAKYAIDGTPIWGKVYEGEGNVSGRYILVADESTDQTKVHLVGTFTGELTLPIDFFEETFLANTDASPLSWIAMTFEDDLTSSAAELNSGMSVFPNPAVNYLQIDEKTNGGTYIITDVAGRELTKTSKNGRLDVSHLNPGVYALRSATELNTTATTFVKM